ncbi:hypothetical protein Slin15195_G116150 [Septoria linicola]|uniref:Zn(2)-C6 fungal-type domain-containing protein n=1 Tax=Septoria linicola TaxID=215465 RepID=A0A9Q9B719_9PEZI|nr:hypothetical protein Slin14017_G093170 [Septoria linicola]USW58296.1 hypothetical protein Slin15195_G116150 [Septoria linicola]
MAIAQQITQEMATIPRPIERLPVRKTVGDQKEAMNCKSCRKRKIKCNRMKPSCEACQVFNCPCIYDAIPKKRGPKTDVLEALLKRVNGLEKRLKDEQKSASPEEASLSPPSDKQDSRKSEEAEVVRPSPPVPDFDFAELRPARSNPISIEPAPPAREAMAFTDALLDTYFARLHNKPYYILDETATRQRLRDGRLPVFLVNAIHAVAIRYVPHLCGGHSGAIRSSQDYAHRARSQIDVDEPNIDNLQALLLLTMANFQNGRGKRCYMTLTHAVSMEFALNLHRELPAELRIAPSEREGRRKLFWTCYLMDRFTVSGSKRPSLIADESIYLRLPAWRPQGSQVMVDGNFFPSAGQISGVSNAAQGSGAMLIEIVRVLGVTNRYLAAGGVKGDSHFPWHAQSTLSRIRSDLDYWAAATQDIFTSIDTLFGSHDSSTLVLSKLIYHLIHCLIYRPFLPIDLAELSGSGQHQSWQIEATNLCFLHANAIAELVEIGKNTALLDWPSFVGYAVCTAGTIHVHGAHYLSYREGDAFCHSAEFLNREMAQLFELRSIWAGVQHQRNTLQAVYASHAQLVKQLSSSPMRFSPVFQMEDFFDRYPGCYIDGAHVSFSDIVMENVDEGVQMFQDTSSGWRADPYMPTVPSQHVPHTNGAVRKAKKRRATAPVLPYPTSKHEILAHQSQGEEQPQQVPEPAVIDENNDQQEPEELQEANPMLFQGDNFTPNFGFSPIPMALNLKSQSGFDPYQGRVLDQQTPGGFSGSAESGNAEVENDPFLSLLEQLAENDTTTGFGGQGDFDFYMGTQT